MIRILFLAQAWAQPNLNSTGLDADKISAAAVAASTQTVACPSGEYYKNNVVCAPCEPGYYCPGGWDTVMIPCSPGETSDWSAGSCNKCPAGYYCNDPKLPPIPCAQGTYSLEGFSACKTCSATNILGAICKDDGTIEECTAGQKCTDGSNPNWYKEDCPATYECPDFNTMTKCPSGTYAGVNQAKCKACPVGHYCPVNIDNGSETGAAAPIVCPAGTTASQPSATQCTVCQKGEACPDPTKPKQTCQPGTFAALIGQTECKPCPAGHSCEDSSTWPVVCAEGYWSEQGWAQCRTCPAGFHCESRVSIQACSSGSYSYAGQADCVTTPAGYFQRNTSEAPTVCPNGWYSMPGQASCTACPIGYKCPNVDQSPAACLTGTFQNETGKTFCKKCPLGYKCSSTTGAPVKCEDFVISPEQIYQKVSDGTGTQCITCPKGYACPDKTYASRKQCAAGSYSVEGQLTCTTCPAGSFCPNTVDQPQSCPNGEYSSAGSCNCFKCPIGYNCPNKDGTYMIKACKPGEYQSEAGGTCKKCESGFACPQVQGGLASKIECPTGYYSKQNSTQCYLCPPGKMCPTAGAEPQDCPDKQVSFGGATSCSPCPKGFLCPTKSTMALCPIYHYSKAGETTCLPCPSGKTCQYPDQDEPQACPAGYYGDTLDYTCQLCPLGHYCPGGETNPRTCKAGQYSPAVGASTCTTCPTGYFSKAIAQTCSPVPAGWSSAADNSGLHSSIAPCASGTYSYEGELECTTCPDGWLCPPMTGEPTAWENSCPLGYYCQRGIQYACPGGTYGILERAKSESQGCADCPAGYYCPSGSSNYELYPCPLGAYCPGNAAAPTNCKQGYFNDMMFGKQIGDCQLCPAGQQCGSGQKNRGEICQESSYCPRGSYPGQYPCPAGTYGGNMTGKAALDHCVTCPAGFHCPEGTVTPIAAPPGTYQPYAGVSAPQGRLLCHPGYYCPYEGQTNYYGYICKQGYYCPAGSSNETEVACPSGTFSDRRGLHNPLDCDICPKGMECDEASTSTNGKMTECPKNHYCRMGTRLGEKQACPAGTYFPLTRAMSLEDCEPCPPGKYCESGKDPAPCPVGHYCPEYTNSSFSFPCPAGTYNGLTERPDDQFCLPTNVGFYSNAGASAAIPCPAGTYNDFSNIASKCLSCPAGSFCGNQTVEPTPCSYGEYSDKGQATCTKCPAGTFCPELGTTGDKLRIERTCDQGLLCVKTGYSNQGLDVWPNNEDHGCAKGAYCPRGTEVAVLCPNGTYNPVRARVNENDCLISPAGTYTQTEGASNYTGLCDEGYFCPEGSSLATQEKCPNGTYRNIKGGVDAASCAPCPPGRFCKNMATVTPVDCPAGYYCPMGTIAPEPCPVGTFGSKTQLEDSKSCEPCPPGQYCWQNGWTVASTQQNYYACDAGFYCFSGSSEPTPIDGVTGWVCPRGRYCPEGNTNPQQCDETTFNAFEGGKSNADCSKCWPGYYCRGSNDGEPKGRCFAGKICPEGTAYPQTQAQPGYYAPEGSSQQFQCTPGTYTDQAGSSSCLQCPAGKNCNKYAMTQMDECPRGYYCLASVYFTDRGIAYKEMACPRGTFQDQVNASLPTQCQACTRHSYCSQKGLSAAEGRCSAGYYCKSGAKQKMPVFRDTSTADNYGYCRPGMYCEDPASLTDSTIMPKKCPAGKFQDFSLARALSDCLPCTEGQKCPVEGTTKASDNNCDLGYYCPSGTINPTSAQQCPATTYCPNGATWAMTCRTGYYQPSTKQSKCQVCPSGQYCKDGIANACPEGFVCR